VSPTNQVQEIRVARLPTAWFGVLDTFELSTKDWSRGRPVTSCAAFNVTLLGGYRSFIRNASRLFDLSGHAHEFVKVEFSVLFMDGWGSKRSAPHFLQAYVDGALVWSHAYVETKRVASGRELEALIASEYRRNTLDSRISWTRDACGSVGADVLVKASFYVPHSGGHLHLEMNSTLPKDMLLGKSGPGPSWGLQAAQVSVGNGFFPLNMVYSSASATWMKETVLDDNFWKLPSHLSTSGKCFNHLYCLKN
jgi:hypothetical protein